MPVRVIEPGNDKGIAMCEREPGGELYDYHYSELRKANGAPAGRLFYQRHDQSMTDHAIRKQRWRDRQRDNGQGK